MGFICTDTATALRRLCATKHAHTHLFLSKWHVFHKQNRTRPLLLQLHSWPPTPAHNIVHAALHAQRVIAQLLDTLCPPMVLLLLLLLLLLAIVQRTSPPARHLHPLQLHQQLFNRPFSHPRNHLLAQLHAGQHANQQNTKQNKPQNTQNASAKHTQCALRSSLHWERGCGTLHAPSNGRAAAAPP